MTKYTLYLYVPVSIYILKNIFEMFNNNKENDFSSTCFITIGLIVAGMIFSFGLLKIVSIIFHNFIVNNCIEKSKKTDDKIHQHYLIKNIVFGIFYYGIMSILNYYVIYNYQIEYLPKMIGGRLNTRDFMKSLTQPISTPVKYVFMFSIGISIIC
jgi:hypothetical protein